MQITACSNYPAIFHIQSYRHIHNSCYCFLPTFSKFIWRKLFGKVLFLPCFCSAFNVKTFKPQYIFVAESNVEVYIALSQTEREMTMVKNSSAVCQQDADVRMSTKVASTLCCHAYCVIYKCNCFKYFTLNNICELH